MVYHTREEGAVLCLVVGIGVGFAIFGLLLGRGVLVLLVLRDQVVHVGLGFREFHFVHALTSVPVPGEEKYV